MGAEEPDADPDAHRSKRAQIKDVLRRHEQGRLSEADAVEELLKLTR